MDSHFHHCKLQNDAEGRGVEGWKVITRRTKPDSSWRYTAEGQEKMNTSDYRGNSVLQSKKKSP